MLFQSVLFVLTILQFGLSLPVTDPYQTNGTVYINAGGDVTYKAGVVDPEGLGYATFTDGLLYNGWGTLEVKVGYAAEQTSDMKKMYAAGFLEGALTYKHIYNHYVNLAPVFLNGKSHTVLSKLKNFLNEQQAWMQDQAFKHRDEPLWNSVGLILHQYEGLKAGYKHIAPKSMQLENFAFQVLNMAGDLLDLLHVVDKSGRPNFDRMSKDELKAYVWKNSHCSALIKVLGAYENIFFSHSTWFVYQSTNRIYKYYSFNVSSFASKKVSFSSYPGTLVSLDDFYMMDNGLIMLQTTNNVFNMTLYDQIVPNSIPAWMRVRVANHMAVNSSHWGYWLSQYNSGTYNNQYMILDLRKVKLNESIDDGALTVVEQIPGLVEYADQTDKLRLGYWPSYNVPFYERVYNRSGYPDIVRTKGMDMSYQLAPRAKIFRRDEGKVVDMESMKHIMRYNEYMTDPYSEDNSCDTVCCRGDLLKSGTMPNGCQDTKVADYHMARQRTAWVINGPTRGDNLKPFTWTQFKNTSHVGLPETYNFDFVLMKPTL